MLASKHATLGARKLFLKLFPLSFRPPDPLSAVGLTCLLIGLVGTYTPSKTTLIQEIHDLRHKAPPRTEWAKQLVLPKPTEYKVVENKHVELKPKRKGLTPANGQQLKLTFSGETPLGDDDFDAAGIPHTTSLYYTHIIFLVLCYM